MFEAIQSVLIKGRRDKNLFFADISANLGHPPPAHCTGKVGEFSGCFPLIFGGFRRCKNTPTFTSERTTPHISLGQCKAEHQAVRYKLKSCTVPIFVPFRLSNIPALLYRPDVCNCTVPYAPRTVPAYAVRDPA